MLSILKPSEKPPYIFWAAEYYLWIIKDGVGFELSNSTPHDAGEYWTIKANKFSSENFFKSIFYVEESEFDKEWLRTVINIRQHNELCFGEWMAIKKLIN